MKRINGYKNYWIDLQGNVYSRFSRKTLSPAISKRGYWVLVLINNKSIKKTVYIHRLLAKAYILEEPMKTYVNHKDGVKTNNKITNLEWCTSSENIKHAYVIGLRTPNSTKGSGIGNSKLTEKNIPIIRQMRKQGIFLKDIGSHFNVSYRTIWDVTSGRRWSHVI